MSKAVMGAALIGVDVALIGGAIFSFGATAFADALVHTALGAAIVAIGTTGVAMEAGAIADALTQNRALGVTIRQPAANRNFVYGMARVGGNAIFESTTGSGPAQRNYVIILADHPCNAAVNLFLDGREVHWQGSGDGWEIRNGYGFGGNAGGGNFTDEGGNEYNFDGLVYAKVEYGDQPSGVAIFPELTANDPRWAASANGAPSCSGCTVMYLKLEADSAMFPSDPEIRVTIQGNNQVWDPRTNTVGYTQNWALCVADALMNSEYGVGESRTNINTAQLVAAANVCDEQIFSPNAGATESQFTINGQWDTGTSPQSLLESMLPAAQGRLSYLGGQWYIFPAYYPGPSFTFNEGDILNTSIAWTGAKKIRERYSRCRGTFLAPRFPYAVAGNLYDSNGFYDGTRANLFGLEWMPESYPDYAQDPLHGYPVDQWLAADNGIERVLNLDFKCTISLATAQRLAKIALLRNRLGGGSTTLTLSLAAYQAIPCDVIEVNYAPLGWTNKLFEIVGVQLRVDYPDDGPPKIVVDLSVNETSPAIYEWQPAPVTGSTIEDELTITDLPTTPFTPASIYVVSPPSAVTVTDATTALAIGVHQPQLQVTWTAAPDAFVSQYQIQYQASGSSTWVSAATADASTTFAYITPVASGTTYNVRVRTLRSSGATSAWATGTGATS